MKELPVPSSKPADIPGCPGRWESSFSSSEAVAAARELSELQAASAGLFWLEFDPLQAVVRLCHYRPGSDDSPPTSRYVTSANRSLRSRVNEYGGGSYCISGGGVFFVDEKDQQIYAQSLTEDAAKALTQAPESRFGDLFYDRAFDRILCVRETHGDTVTQDLVAISRITGAIEVFASGADFYASPRVDEEGCQAAWIEWSVAHMPWDKTRLAFAMVDPQTGALVKAGAGALRYLQPEHHGGQSILQPRFDELGRLWCLSDHQGWWQLYRIDESGAWRCLDNEAADQALPPSQLGHQQYVIIAGRGIALTKLKRGWMHLEYCPDEKPEPSRLLPEYSLFRYLQYHQGELYCIAGAPDQTTAVVRVDLQSGRHQILAGAERPLADADLARPQAFSFSVGGPTRSHGFFYRPANRQMRLGRHDQPPVVVMTHGGPTSATYPVFNPLIQFWTQRGFAVADLNYRGSSGFGRAYRQALRHRWGIAEVRDVLASLDELAQRRWCDTDRAFIRGSSAGGFTTLSVVASSQRFLAGCSLYGVSDPWALRQMTHRFESHYLDWLIADGHKPERFHARAPINRAKEIKTPMIFFQGGRDKIVVPSQTETMVETLKAEGLEVAYHYYPEEGHGFRQPDTRSHALDQELAFFRRQLHSAAYP